MLRAVAWVAVALGAAIVVTVLFATRGGAIQKELRQAGERLKEKLPELPTVPGAPGSTAPEAPAAPEPAKEPAAPAQPPPGTVTGKGSAPARPFTVSDPPPVAKARHKVARGETLYTLAETYYEDGSLWKLIAEANGIKDPSELREGMELVIPGR
jgi:5'-nucleotidase